MSTESSSLRRRLADEDLRFLAALPEIERELPASPHGERYVEVSPGSWIDTDLARRVVLSRLSPQDARIPALRTRFFAEARLVAQLDHPGIVPVHRIGADPSGAPYAVKGGIEGDSIEEIAPGAQVALILRIVRRAAEAIDYAHHQGVVHSRITPSTIVLGPHGGVVVTGWETAQRVEPTDRATGYDSGSHPPAEPSWEKSPYTPPEQAAGHVLDRRADVYALGATLCYALAGKPPSRAAAVGRIRGVVRPLAAIVQKAMSRRRRDRYATAREFAADIARFEAGLEVRARRDALLVAAGRWFARRPRVAAIALAMGVAVVLGAFALAAVGYRERQGEARRMLEAESRRASACARNLELARRAGPDHASLRKGLVHANLAADHARSREERRAAGELRVELYLALAEKAIEASGQTTGAIEEALAHVSLAEDASGGEIEVPEIARVRRAAEGRVLFSIATDPAGGRVRIHALPSDSSQPADEIASGSDGDLFDLEFGTYLVLGELSGASIEAALPVRLERYFTENLRQTLPLPPERPEGFVYIPPGWFQSGHQRSWKRIERGFFLSRTELSWEEYLAFLADLGPAAAKREPRAWLSNRMVSVRDVLPVPSPDLPVFGVSHEDLDAYCEWRNQRDLRWRYRLPEADEWEWAARGADGREYPWGTSWRESSVRAGSSGSGLSLGSITESIRARSEGRSVFGCHHMSGNVFEWTATPLNELDFVLRGGSWGSNPLECTTWYSSKGAKNLRGADGGGRLAAQPR